MKKLNDKTRLKTGQRELRIIGGQWRSRRIGFLDLPGLRPTPDRIRETLFNWLQFEITRCHVLDLFAGSGALGFEAASRGAESVTFVELNPAQAAKLQQNSAILAANNCTTVCADSMTWLKQQESKQFQLILLDPPFHQGLPNKTLALLNSCGFLRPKTWVYLETEQSVESLELPADLMLYRKASAGLVNSLLFYVDDTEKTTRHP
jgi:16S rRNA (guanine966-N2)-methyltransferase